MTFRSRREGAPRVVASIWGNTVKQFERGYRGARRASTVLWLSR